MSSAACLSGAKSWQHLAGQGWFDSRTPMLLLDPRGRIVEVNAAFRQLLGLHVAGRKGGHFEELEQQLGGAIEGHLFAPQGLARRYFAAESQEPLILRTEDLSAVIGECCYRSGRFGDVRLRTCELACVDHDTGVCAGASLSLEILEIADAAAFRKTLDRFLRHELMWGVYASSYDRILPHLTFYQEVVERHIEALRPQHVQAILDVGAGTGTVTERLLRAGKWVTAVDICRGMLEKLYAKILGELLGRLQVIEDTAEKLPQLADETFDGVNVLLAFFDMSDPRAALHEAQRVLKPGGLLAITEPRKCFNVEQLMAAAERDLEAKHLLPLLAGDWKRIQSVAPLVRETIQVHNRAAEFQRVDRQWNAEILYDQLNLQGFLDLSFRPSHLGNCATIIGRKPFALRQSTTG